MHADVNFEDYETAAAAIEELKRQLRDHEILMWAMVGDLAFGYPGAWSIEEDAEQQFGKATSRKEGSADGPR